MNAAAKIEQRTVALSRANDTRLAIARLREHVHAGTHNEGRERAAEFLKHPDTPASAIRTIALLAAIKWMHVSRARTMIARSGIGDPDKRVRDLTERQRRHLAARLEGVVL